MWFQRPTIVLSMAVLALIGFIVLPVAATLRNKSELDSSIFPDATVSDAPSSIPSGTPSTMPSSVPSDVPSSVPSVAPSDVPSVAPSVAPSTTPTEFFSIIPTSPILTLSDAPSFLPLEQQGTAGPTRLEEMTDVRRKLRRQRRHRNAHSVSSRG